MITEAWETAEEMSQSADSNCTAAFGSRRGVDQRIQLQVHQVLRQFRCQPLVTDRRSDRREPFPYPIYITPIAEDGSPQIDDTIVVLGKHLSEHGLDFYYQAPLAYRRVIASWEGSPGNWLALLVDLRWCRSNRHGWYENGGRFLQVVDSPLAAQAVTRRPEERP